MMLGSYILCKTHSLFRVFIAENSKFEASDRTETTLETIFNKFAAEQEEEVGPVRGLVTQRSVPVLTPIQPVSMHSVSIQGDA